MILSSKLLAVVGASAMAVTPMALAGGAAAHPGHATPTRGEAYGKRCQSESKKHVAGQKGTPFSQCVTAMTKLEHSKSTSPAKACAALSHKHVAGQKGTPFSRCVTAGNELRQAAKKKA